MSLSGFLSKLFGNKSQRDLKEIDPILKKIQALRPEMEKLSVDELRRRIDNVRVAIVDATAEDQNEITKLKEQVETLPYDERQPIWTKIDELEERIIKTIDDQLDNALPEVFAVLRETAARFAKNDEIVVEATEMDRNLAAQGRDFGRIEGDKAIWKNHW